MLDLCRELDYTLWAVLIRVGLRGACSARGGERLQAVRTSPAELLVVQQRRCACETQMWDREKPAGIAAHTAQRLLAIRVGSPSPAVGECPCSVD